MLTKKENTGSRPLSTWLNWSPERPPSSPRSPRGTIFRKSSWTRSCSNCAMPASCARRRARAAAIPCLDQPPTSASARSSARSMAPGANTLRQPHRVRGLRRLRRSGQLSRAQVDEQRTRRNRLDPRQHDAGAVCRQRQRHRDRGLEGCGGRLTSALCSSTGCLRSRDAAWRSRPHSFLMIAAAATGAMISNSRNNRALPT